MPAVRAAMVHRGRQGERGLGGTRLPVIRGVLIAYGAADTAPSCWAVGDHAPPRRPGPFVLILPFLAVAGLALVHVLSPVPSVLDRVPRSRWLSFGCGVAVVLVPRRV